MNLGPFPAALAAALAVLTSAAAQAATLNLATGLDAAGNVQTSRDALDAFWQVTGGVNPQNPPQAFVAATGDPDWDPGWIAGGPRSNWIAANPEDRFGNGIMSFTRQFTVEDPLTALISKGFWTIDDWGTLSLNGHLLSSLPSGSPWKSLHAFSADASDFVAGVNILTIQVTATDVIAEGARLEGILTTDGTPPPPPGMPEPQAWILMLMGFASLGLVLRARGSHPAPATRSLLGLARRPSSST